MRLCPSYKIEQAGVAAKKAAKRVSAVQMWLIPAVLFCNVGDDE